MAVICTFLHFFVCFLFVLCGPFLLLLFLSCFFVFLFFHPFFWGGGGGVVFLSFSFSWHCLWASAFGES